MNALRSLLLLTLLPSLVAMSAAKETIRLANQPALSPDGSQLAFAWRGDIWIAASTGGLARQLTRHTGVDSEPEFSPDGTQIAFVSDRTGSRQVFVMPVEGGLPEQLTHHTAGHTLHGWYPDGQSLLVSGDRDHFWRDGERFFRIGRQQRGTEELLFDDFGTAGSLSPDGKRLLFTREGPAWWRKGYHGSQAAQVWLSDLEGKGFTRLVDHDRGCLWPLWRPDGKAFYYVSGQNGTFNLVEHQLEDHAERQLTQLDDDGTVFPCIARNGSLIVFRQLFDLYRLNPNSAEPPQKIELFDNGDSTSEPIVRRRLTQASDVAFSHDGLDIAFISGGDLWVMDTELREPIQVTHTPEEERDPVFSPSGETLWFVSDAGGQADIWKAMRGDAKKYWWLNDKFTLTRVTQDAEVERNLRFSPDGLRMAYVRGHGDLWIANRDGTEPQRLIKSWNPPSYDWSPDGKWLVYSVSDNEFNSDVWIVPLDGSRPPFNVSRHPDNEYQPSWSPDGRIIAFTGRRIEDEVDIYYVYLRDEDEEKRTRDRVLERAMEKVGKARGVRTRSVGVSPAAPGTATPAAPATAPEGAAAGGASSVTATPPTFRRPDIKIDWEGIHDRIHRIAIANSTESGLIWSPDSKKLAFSATVDGKRGTYYVEIGDSLSPKSLATQTGSSARWIAAGDQIVWLSSGVPASLTSAGKVTEYRLAALQEVNVGDKHRAAFELAWRTMRDYYYDERLGNRNWDAIRRKYSDMAATCLDETSLATVVQLMLGELNGSHLGFTPRRDNSGAPPVIEPPTTPAPPGTPNPMPAPIASSPWTEVTPHLGLRFDPSHKGPGLLVRDVVPGSPADQKKSHVAAGETVLSIDGTVVDPAMDLTKVLNGRLDRDIVLQVRAAGGAERQVTLRPISYAALKPLLYEKWVRDNRALVDKLSQGGLGYLHVRAMDTSSFHRFEEELYSAGAGKHGLVIDVRNNGGGSTTDHLLTALTQPVHAITVPRGGEPGYPQDRKVYATWNKPIVVLCNQNSFSNAEIFSHAIKTLGRGSLVGVPTAGGVISTGAASIMDVGTLRLPGRGWYLPDTGEDMELHGAVPHHIVWPEPCQLPAGKDIQIEKAIEVLLADVKKWNDRPQPKLKKASER